MIENSLLWSITHPITNKEHFLYGTMHVKNETAYKHLDRVLPLLRQVEIYAGEMDLGDSDMVTLQDHILLPTHFSLRDLYGERKYERMVKILRKAYDIDLERYHHFKPLMISNMIAEKIMSEDYDVSLDQYLWMKAQDCVMHSIGLESVADQITIMNSISIDIQKKMLSASLKNVTTYRRKIIKVGELYANENIQRLFLTTKKSLGKLRKRLLYDRNNFMADRILEVTNDEQSFISVGAAHLAGQYGLLRLLKKSGYEIKAIR